MRKLIAGTLAGIALAVATPIAAKTTPETLLDRVQIEDLLTSYYSHFGGGEIQDFGAYYTEDGVFDVNGQIFEGRDAIVALYASMGEQEGAVAERGTFHMLLTNLDINVHEGSESATATMIWTGILNTEISDPPEFVEQGREYDYLVKQGGEWLIAKRVVIADSGLPAMFVPNYSPRTNYDIEEGME